MLDICVNSGRNSRFLIGSVIGNSALISRDYLWRMLPTDVLIVGGRAVVNVDFEIS